MGNHRLCMLRAVEWALIGLMEPARRLAYWKRWKDEIDCGFHVLEQVDAAIARVFSTARG